MIVDAIINVLMLPIEALMSIIPSVNVSIPPGVFDTLNSIVASLSYLLPINVAFKIIGIRLSLYGIKLAFAIIDRIKGFIPTMGG